MNKFTRVFGAFALLTLLFVLVGCAGQNPSSGVTGPNAAGNPVLAGFWLGYWHGATIFISFIGSLFNHNIGIYETHNEGWLYNLGYLFGLGALPGLKLSSDRTRK